MNKNITKSELEKTDVTKEWWRGACIYQIYPRSYQDTNGDGIGDLKGITERLEYIASLGVDGIWISPFFTSPMKDFGYDVADFCGVDPMFGTLEDFDELLAKAHSLGLKLIIDQVYSHTSDAHEWFKQSRSSRDSDKSDYYIWADPKPDGSPPNNWQSVFYGPSWAWDARRKQYYFHNFLPEQPDLNVHNPKVQEEIIKVAKFWLDRGVDGFRLDALNFLMHDPELRDNPVRDIGAKTRPFDYQYQKYSMSHPDIPAFIERLAGAINSYPERFTVAEVGGEKAIVEMKEFIKGDNRLSTAYSFIFLYAEEISPEFVRNAVEQWPATGRELWPSWAFSNHDAPRCMSRWAKGRDEQAAARCFMALLASLRGNIFLYQGEELGLEQAEIPFEKLQDPEAIKNWPLTLGRDGARTPMIWSGNGGFSTSESWLPIDEKHYTKSVAAQENDVNSMLHYTRKVLELRRNNNALLLGNIEFIQVDSNLLVFTREYDGEKVICAFNLGFANAAFNVPTGAEVILSANGAVLGNLPPLGLIIAK